MTRTTAKQVVLAVLSTYKVEPRLLDLSNHPDIVAIRNDLLGIWVDPDRREADLSAAFQLLDSQDQRALQARLADREMFVGRIQDFAAWCKENDIPIGFDPSIDQ